LLRLFCCLKDLKALKGLKAFKSFIINFKNKQEMKKNLILMMLLLAGVGSMNGQEPTIPAGPIMVVVGNVVNTGTITSMRAIDLRTGQIDNKSTGEILTPYLNVEAGTLLTNEAGGYICVGVDCVTPKPNCPGAIIPGGAFNYKDGSSPVAGDGAKNAKTKPFDADVAWSLIWPLPRVMLLSLGVLGLMKIR
jgi:hypothetical protein